MRRWTTWTVWLHTIQRMWCLIWGQCLEPVILSSSRWAIISLCHCHKWLESCHQPSLVNTWCAHAGLLSSESRWLLCSPTAANLISVLSDFIQWLKPSLEVVWIRFHSDFDTCDFSTDVPDTAIWIQWAHCITAQQTKTEEKGGHWDRDRNNSKPYVERCSRDT